MRTALVAGEVGAFESKLIDHGGICLPKGTVVSATAMATRVGAMTTSDAGDSGAATSRSAEATSSAASSAAQTTGSSAAGNVAVPVMGVPAVLGAVAWVAGFVL